MPKYDEYYVEEMAKEMGHRVLLLQLHHCELNPTELTPAEINRHIEMNNTNFFIEDMAQLIQRGFHNEMARRWKYCVEHMKGAEADL
jgi:hypothetical protein